MIWLFIYFAMIPIQLTNYVLCIGDDGHVSFEFAVNGSCTEIPFYESKHTNISDSFCNDFDEDHCGKCVDLPIFTSLITEPVIAPYDTNHPSQFTVYTIVSTNTVRISPIISPITLSSIPRIDPTLISLQTVTLLI